MKLSAISSQPSAGQGDLAMPQTGENVRCLVLDEFVDDASKRRQGSSPVEGKRKTDCLRELVHCVAGEMGVPQFHLEEVVAKVLSVVGPQIEERVRKEVQEELKREQQNHDDSFVA